MFKNRFGIYLFLGIISAGFAATISQSSDSKISPELKARAHKIFTYDQNHLGELPPNRLYALSIAIKFQDAPGVERAVQQLEPHLRHF